MAKNPMIDDLIDLAVLFGVELSDRQIDLYLDGLSDVDPDDLHDGVRELVRTAKWMPRVSEMRQAAMMAREKREAAEAENWHDRRNAQANALARSPWVQVETWERRSQVSIPPVVIGWQTCAQCGVSFAGEWGTCPDCSRDDAEVEQLVQIGRAA